MTKETNTNPFDKPDLNELAHYGVKGMKWGHRRRQERIARVDRVASGKAGLGEKARFLLTETSAKSLRVNNGISGAAKVQAANLRAVDKRLARGDATVKDIVMRYGGDRIIITGKKDPSTRYTPDSKKLTPKKGTSAVTRRVMDDYNNLNDQDFFRKYAATKTRYSKRVERYGDPYMNSPLAKLGKKLDRR